MHIAWGEKAGKFKVVDPSSNSDPRGVFLCADRVTPTVDIWFNEFISGYWTGCRVHRECPDVKDVDTLLLDMWVHRYDNKISSLGKGVDVPVGVTLKDIVFDGSTTTLTLAVC